ncbi:uncharacterized protein LOC141528601 [Cotesia typhae]|uniref:uncharacterized protein LOC141528601 n=1 Tax=Cotesia typhae TaxID=2053667 RepID=UPI003D682609
MIFTEVYIFIKNSRQNIDKSRSPESLKTKKKKKQSRIDGIETILARGNFEKSQVKDRSRPHLRRCFEEPNEFVLARETKRSSLDLLNLPIILTLPSCKGSIERTTLSPWALRIRTKRRII